MIDVRRRAAESLTAKAAKIAKGDVSLGSQIINTLPGIGRIRILPIFAVIAAIAVYDSFPRSSQRKPPSFAVHTSSLITAVSPSLASPAGPGRRRA